MRPLSFHPFWGLFALAGIILTGCGDSPSAPPPPAAPVSDPVPAGFTPISTLPCLITNAGRYFVTKDLACSNEFVGILIRTNNVEINLNGKKFLGTSTSYNGISIVGHLTNVHISNGLITGWKNMGIMADFAYRCQFSDLVLTNNGIGMNSGPSNSFLNCQALYNYSGDGLSARDYTVMSNCLSLGNLGEGIVIGHGSQVQNCVANDNKRNGFLSTQAGYFQNCRATNNAKSGLLSGHTSTIDHCIAVSNGMYGVEGATGLQVADSLSTHNGWDGFSLFGHSGIRNCRALFNVRDGIRVGFNCKVLTNYCASNGLGNKDAANIHLLLKGSRAERNEIDLDNNVGLWVTESPNQVIKNVIRRRSAAGETYRGHPKNLATPILTRPEAAGDPPLSNYELTP